MKKDVCFVKVFCKKLEEKNIDYCILRNVDEIKAGYAHDIDMTVDISKFNSSIFLLKAVATNLGWRLHLETGTAVDKNNIKSYHFYTIEFGKPILLHFDFFPTFTWNGMVLLSNRDLIEEIRNDAILHTSNHGVESVTKLFIRLLFNKHVKDKYKPYILETFQDHPEQVKKTMNKFLSKTMAQSIFDCVLMENWMQIENMRKKIIRDIKTTVKYNGAYMANKIQHKWHLIKKATKRTGIMIVFEGTDGSGKTSIINELPVVLGRSFSKEFVNYYHWRPEVLKSRKIGVDATAIEPHKKKKYGKTISTCKFLFFNIDYLVGYWGKIRWQLAKGHLVVFDRYYYDYYLDKLRYRMDISDRVLDLCKPFIPKPDITFALIGDAQTIYERKKEISLEEIKMQIERLSRKSHKFENTIIVDVNQNIDDVINRVSYSILECCEKKINRGS